MIDTTNCPICLNQVEAQSDENEQWHINCAFCGYNTKADALPKAFDHFETKVQCEEVFNEYNDPDATACSIGDFNTWEENQIAGEEP